MVKRWLNNFGKKRQLRYEQRVDLSKKQKTKQSNGKGDKSRIANKKRFDENWDKIFKKEKK